MCLMPFKGEAQLLANVRKITMWFITMAFSILNKQLSVLLNTIVIIMSVCCLPIPVHSEIKIKHLLTVHLLSVWFVFSYVHLT